MQTCTFLGITITVLAIVTPLLPDWWHLCCALRNLIPAVLGTQEVIKSKTLLKQASICRLIATVIKSGANDWGGWGAPSHIPSIDYDGIVQCCQALELLKCFLCMVLMHSYDILIYRERDRHVHIRTYTRTHSHLYTLIFSIEPCRYGVYSV